MRASLLVAAAVFAASPAFAQRVQTDNNAQHVIVDQCLSGCGSGGVGASVDISSVSGNVIVGGDVPVKFSTPQHVVVDSGGGGAGGLTNTELRATPVPVSGTVSFSNTSLAVTNAGTFAVQAAQAGTWTIQPGNTANTTPWLFTLDQTGTHNDVDATITNASLAVTGTFWQATQPVSGTFWQTTQPVSGTFWQTTQPVSFTQPALVAGSALIGKVGIDQTTPGTTNKVSLGSDVVHAIIDSATLGTVTVSGTVTANAGSNLNTSALALEAGHLATIDTSTAKIPAQGQAAMAASLPVAIASNQSAVPVSGSITAVQATGTNLHIVCDSGCGTAGTGQQLMAASAPVVIASNQTSVPVTATVSNGVTAGTAGSPSTDVITVQGAPNALAQWVAFRGSLPLNPCNAVRRTNCAPKGY